MEALGLLERRGSRRASAKEEELDPAVYVVVNPRFGLVAVGTLKYVCVPRDSMLGLTTSGKVHLISVPPYPSKPRHSHTFDLKHSANLRTSTPWY
jgi:hypothetical protein